MLKKMTLEALEIVGALMTAIAALSGVVMYLAGGMADPKIVWFAPMFLTPIALLGIALMVVSALVSKRKQGMIGWSALAFLAALAVTAAVFQFSGLASGRTEPEGTTWGMVALIVSYLYAAVMLGVAGVGVVIARDILRMEPHRHHAAMS